LLPAKPPSARRLAVVDDDDFRRTLALQLGSEGFEVVGDDGYRTNVRTFIKRIRQKFRKTDTFFASIENHGGFGYRWIDR